LLLEPVIATVDQPKYEIGQKAMMQLLYKFKNTKHHKRKDLFFAIIGK